MSVLSLSLSKYHSHHVDLSHNTADTLMQDSLSLSSHSYLFSFSLRFHHHHSLHLMEIVAYVEGEGVLEMEYEVEVAPLSGGMVQGPEENFQNRGAVFDVDDVH